MTVGVGLLERDRGVGEERGGGQDRNTDRKNEQTDTKIDKQRKGVDRERAKDGTQRDVLVGERGDRDRETETDRQTDGQTDRQAGRQAGRQTDRQRQRQRHRE